MTVVAAFLCSDGVVVAADSMLTASMGNFPLAHHKGKKVHVLQQEQIFAFAGDQGLAARLRILADANGATIANTQHPIDYPLVLTQAAIQQFATTHVNTNALGMNAVLAFDHKGVSNCCVFEGESIQPRMLDRDHFYVALGSGKVAADPFLRFLYEVFCQGQQPPLREAVFLAAWTLQYVIETIPGGVAAPIHIGVLERDGGGVYQARELPEVDIQEHLEAITDARQALRDWRDSLHAETATADIPAKPEPPTDSAPTPVETPTEEVVEDQPAAPGDT